MSINVLWQAISQPSIVKMAEKVCKKYNVKELYVFETDFFKEYIDDSEYLPHLIKERFNQKDMILGNYNHYVWSSDMKPLDKELLDKMSLYEPEALKMLERSNGNNNPAESRFIQYHKHLKYWNNFLDNANIDLFICGAPPHAWYDYILLRLCQLRAIPTIMQDYYPFQSTTNNVRFRVMPNWEEYDDKIISKINELRTISAEGKNIELPADLEADYNTFRGTKDRLFNINVQPEHPILDRISFFQRLYHDNHKYAVSRAFSHFKKRRETKKIVRYYNSISVNADYNEKYIYFPMHYQPEMSTCPLGGWFVHLYLAVEMLSYYAPKDIKIYVREHPTMKSYPPNTRVSEHYDLMRCLGNIKLISLEDDSQKLIDNALAVASITGSVGYEALFKKKPYIMFGDQILKYAPGTLNVRNREDCIEAISKISSGEIKYNDGDVRAFLRAISDIMPSFESKPSGKGDQLIVDTEDNVEKLYKLYSEAIERALV